MLVEWKPFLNRVSISGSEQPADKADLLALIRPKAIFPLRLLRTETLVAVPVMQSRPGVCSHGIQRLFSSADFNFILDSHVLDSIPNGMCRKLFIVVR